MQHWDYTQSYDWCRIVVSGPRIGLGKDLVVWSVYNPPEGQQSPLPEIQAYWNQPNDQPGNQYHVIAGDFNLHHPTWDAYNRNSAQAEALLDITEIGLLTLYILAGTIIRALIGA